MEKIETKVRNEYQIPKVWLQDKGVQKVLKVLEQMRKTDREDIANVLISETDTLWEDISDDGDGDYKKGTIVLTKDGEKVVDIILKLINSEEN